ncbi:hypothetical protein BT63DRAFT_469619 [Microthyrium microscopicum]|uniref:Uncharacterized protein n=1 Tax=Microthyrium microscopicum TaxID=703497 RepID=A0A6A6UEL9_9PEZI|nr:hypothetical protein BT63DRAFT_469619 [Microthyrium microscopicum]
MKPSTSIVLLLGSLSFLLSSAAPVPSEKSSSETAVSHEKRGTKILPLILGIIGIIGGSVAGAAIHVTGSAVANAYEHEAKRERERAGHTRYKVSNPWVLMWRKNIGINCITAGAPWSGKIRANAVNSTTEQCCLAQPGLVFQPEGLGCAGNKTKPAENNMVYGQRPESSRGDKTYSFEHMANCCKAHKLDYSIVQKLGTQVLTSYNRYNVNYGTA